MSPKSPRTFHYHACAQAFSANFTRPFHHQIDVQAQSALPVIGGHGHARTENFEFCNFISFKRGYSHVSGGHQLEDDSNNTLATSALEHLNMFDVLTVDSVVSRLYSKHPAGAKEGNITWIGSKFENLRIAGFPVHIELNVPLFQNLLTFDAAEKAFAKGGEFRKIAEDPLGTGTALKPSDVDGVFLCSIVKEIKVDSPGVKVEGHSIYVPGFGKVYLGELLIKRGEKTLTMLRFELGSTTGGSGSGGGTKTNGSHYP
ncbi:MAG: hypothetical protein JSS69_08530 [Acidobacteria bacterium]|nr:hypothetical protein [Acidobacteriota bacterium]MBS1865950.1 hypothetical protein [Acidobacteriota bacterium]